MEPIFTAAYNADVAMVEEGLPDGLTAETAYNTAAEPIHLTYTKQSYCGTSCTWLDFGLQRSVYGQILSETGTLATDRYGYDHAGRLTSAEETPQGGACTTRLYAYDKDSDRTSLTTRSPGIGGACAESGGTTHSYEYDSADRLLAEGLSYDSVGRITKLPGSLAGGKDLTTSYFADDMVASQSQNGITNTFTLDASLRQAGPDGHDKSTTQMRMQRRNRCSASRRCWSAVTRSRRAAAEVGSANSRTARILPSGLMPGATSRGGSRVLTLLSEAGLNSEARQVSPEWRQALVHLDFLATMGGR